MATHPIFSTTSTAFTALRAKEEGAVTSCVQPWQPGVKSIRRSTANLLILKGIADNEKEH
ncbi:UNVERIFIED_CONTAM: hypothetical protein HDU68_002625, partial [Siphonaria sp. JEL0065]